MFLADRSQLIDYASRLWELPPDVTVAEWLGSHVYLTTEETDHAGWWSPRLTPFAVEPLECWRDPKVRSMVLMFGTQVAKTMILMGGCSWWMAHHAERVHWAFDTVDNARDFSKTRWSALWNSPPLQPMIGRDNTNLTMQLGASRLKFTGSNSRGNLKSTPSTVQVGDEVEEWPETALSDLKQRGKARSGGFFALASSPGLVTGPINTEYMGGDQRLYHIPCWSCNQLIVLEKSGLTWSEDARVAGGTWDLSTVRQSARYTCPKCGHALNETEKSKSVRDTELAKWIPTNPHADPRDRSYRINSLYSFWESCTLGNLAVDLLLARQKGLEDELDKNAFAIPEAAEAIELEAHELYALREPFGKDVWSKVLICTVGVDRQHDRLEAELVGWDVHEGSWSLAYEVFVGDPNELEVWSLLDAWLKKPRPVRISAVGVDSGDVPDSVYRFTKPRKARRVFAVRGSSTRGVPIVGRISKNNKANCPVQYVGTHAAKVELFKRLKKTGDDRAEGKPRVMHWPGVGSTASRERDEDYFHQLTGERQVTRRLRGGYGVIEFEAVGRNEAIDTWVYARAMLGTLGSYALEHAQTARDKPATEAPAAAPAPSWANQGM